MPPSAAPSAPLPNLNSLRTWTSIQDDLSPSQLESLQNSPAGRTLRQCQDSCRELRQNLVAGGRSFREARQSGDDEEAARLQRKLQQDAYIHKCCEMERLCPRPTKLYASCWKFANKLFGETYGNNDMLWEMWKEGSLKAVCKPERDLVERCVGKIVSSAVDSLDAGSNTPLGSKTNIMINDHYEKIQ